MLLPPSLILSLIFVAGVLIGLFLFLKPNSAIELQRQFYERINWRIEPISLAKEIRNTKIMGLFLIIISFTTITYMLINNLKGR